MPRTSGFLVAWLAVCAVSSARAESLTWDAAVREARAHNPALAAAREAVEGASSGVTIATAGFLPDLSADASLDRSGSQAVAAWKPVGASKLATDYRFGGSASWSLFEGGGTWAQRRQAVAGLARARGALAQAGARLRQSLRNAFDRLIFNQQDLDVLAQIKDRLNRDTRYLEIQFRSGREPRWTFLKAQADEAGIDWQLSQARLDLAAQQQAVAQLLGRNPLTATDLVAAGELGAAEPPAGVTGLIPRVADAHPDVAVQAASVESDAAGLARARASWFPAVRAGAGLDWSDGGTWPPDRRGWNAGLSVSLPLFSGGADVAAVHQARHAWLGSRLAYDAAVAATRAGIFSAWAAYRAAFDHQPVLRLDAEAATERFRTVKGLYEAGQATYLEFEQAEGGLTQAQQRELSGRLDLAQAAAAFAQAAGHTLDQEGAPIP